MPDENLYPTRVWGVKWVIRKGQLLLYSPYAFRMYRLNNSAAAIWLLSTGQFTAGEIIERMLTRIVETNGVRIDADVVRVELLRGIDQLEEQGLIVRTECRSLAGPDESKLLPLNFGKVRQRMWIGYRDECPTSK